MANEEDAAAPATHGRWLESPRLLGFTAIALAAVLTTIFF